MAKDIWINLPVTDLQKATIFYEAIGFQLNKQAPKSDTMSSFIVGSNQLIVNFFTNQLIESFGQNKVSDTSKGTEVLFSLGADSEVEVDEMLLKAKHAGATIYANGGYKDGWMYGGGFVDLDGHRWNVLYMDFSKL